MAYVKPEEIVENMLQAGAHKANLPIKDLLLRGSLAGAFLGYATTLAILATTQTGLGIVGALVFPVGFV
ncbi:MAG TPA: formate transporter, partial [Nitrosomonas sp.]|nr:formate transporter [Nitrosomonas sp.]